ncbi:hypothetical protein GCM10011519_19870 [Marmoricola endophyticus]|uniref:Pyridoxamine 5'-phosphate oxidase N-terminal domain-containing protein n=1 Tax=Marmoricola endophyticus TaxID=2040280 RepID=A0A917BK61_9ACTN|nr:PPOX class F420-dependent oxidoreductase [Marmoricola endophyticus]GGF46027.1 hypothetical protein GCM10011519_19870 [Marmoricola endophyticus]
MPTVADLAEEPFVSLTTYRQSGAPVATPVWVAADGDGLAITTMDGSGKVRRVRRDPHVTLRPCDRRGRVEDGAPTVEARAEVVESPSGVEALTARVKAKYGLQFRFVMGIGAVLGGRHDRVALRVVDA